MRNGQKASKFSRRAMLAGLAAGSVAPALAQPALDDLPLWAAAQSSGLIFGASSSWEVVRDPAYAELHRTHSRLLVTDVALKFDYIRPTEEVFRFGEADALLNFSRQNGLLLRGHTLFWNDYPPPWLKRKSAAEIERIFERHMETVLPRYAGALHSWDIVNEPFWPGHGAPGGFRRGPWFDAMGPDYIFRAFRRAATLDRTAKLVLNEAFCEQDDPLGRSVRQNLIPLIDRMLDQGLKLDAIGLQAHIKPHLAFNIDTFLRFLDEIAARKLKIYITEFDIDDQSFAQETSLRDERVALWTSRFLDPVLRNRAVDAVITWHLSDKYTWYRSPEVAASRPRNFPARPLPFDEFMREKPMARAMRRAMSAAGPR